MNKTLNHRQIETIQNFWRWVEDNETNIYNAVALGIKNKEVMQHLHRNLNYVSKRIECILFFQNEKVKLYLTVLGCKKLFSKLIALENSIPNLKQISTSIFIKPIINKEPCLNKQDHYYVFNYVKVKISDLYIQLDDYNTKKKISGTVFHPYKATLGLFIVIHTIVILVVGEIAYKKI